MAAFPPRRHHSYFVPGPTNSGAVYHEPDADKETMKDIFMSTMTDFLSTVGSVPKEEVEAFERSVFENLDSVYEDGTYTLQLFEEESLGHTFVTIAIGKINKIIPEKNRMYMVGVFKQIAKDIINGEPVDNNNNNNNNNNNTNNNKSRKQRKNRKQRKQQKTRKQRN